MSEYRGCAAGRQQAMAAFKEAWQAGFTMTTIPDIGLAKASDYFDLVVSPAYTRFAHKQTRANALTFAVAAWHLHDRLWHDRGSPHPKEQFVEALFVACPELRMVRDLADAGKHHALDRPSVKLTKIIGAENPGGIGEISSPLGQTSAVPECTLEIEFDGTCYLLPDVLRRVVEFWRSEITKP
jgi:hypothetical protein